MSSGFGNASVAPQQIDGSPQDPDKDVDRLVGSCCDQLPCVKGVALSRFKTGSGLDEEINLGCTDTTCIECRRNRIQLSQHLGSAGFPTGSRPANRPTITKEETACTTAMPGRGRVICRLPDPDLQCIDRPFSYSNSRDQRLAVTRVAPDDHRAQRRKQ